MSPGEIIRQAVIDQAVSLEEGLHDGIGDAAIDKLAEEGWDVVKLAPLAIEGEVLFRVTEWAR